MGFVGDLSLKKDIAQPGGFRNLSCVYTCRNLKTRRVSDSAEMLLDRPGLVVACLSDHRLNQEYLPGNHADKCGQDNI